MKKTRRGNVKTNKQILAYRCFGSNEGRGHGQGRLPGGVLELPLVE